MRISELIEKLNNTINKQGDGEIVIEIIKENDYGKQKRYIYDVQDVVKSSSTYHCIAIINDELLEKTKLN